MPKRILLWSRTEPSRTILLIVSFMTLCLQLLVLTPWVGAPLGQALINIALVGAASIWAMIVAWRHNVKQMPRAAFVMHFIWLWSGLTRLAFSPDPAMLLWGPFLVVAMALAVVYISLNAEKRRLSE